MSDHLFETARLVVRQFTSADLDAFATLCTDPQVMRYVGDGTTLPRGEVERWIGVCQHTARATHTPALHGRRVFPV